MRTTAEWSGADFGDLRLGRRLELFGNALAAAPSESLPKALKDSAGLEGAYRFLNNERVSPERILVPHQVETKRRIVEAKAVVIAHDTSDFQFSGEERVGLGRLKQHNEGFLCHAALAITADGSRRPLGVIGASTIVRSHEKKPRLHPRKRRADVDRESQRWWALVEEVEATLAGEAEAVHVMDREADCFELLSKMVASHARFVVRSCFDRLLDDAEKLFTTLKRMEAVAQREVPLSPRKRSPLPKQRRTFPARAGRSATLSFSAATVVLRRPDGLPKDLPETLTLNAVQVIELQPPDGQDPVCWRLLTTEPIASPEQVLAIVDFYRCRWLIEEYWKALKTGCAVEKRQLESAHALLNFLAVSIPIAWELLLIRSVCRQGGDAPGAGILPALRLEVLRAASGGKLPLKPTARDIMMAIAALGGHIKNNGDPGWQVLGRGYDDLLLLESGYLLARKKM
jgi:hypothetical protein